MYKIGVVPGKFFPPHRGHLYQIIRAATMCEKLYVVVSDNEDLVLDKCRRDHLPFIPIKTRALWLSIELQNIENISVLTLDETDIPEYPHGAAPWSAKLMLLIPERFDIIFGGEQEYTDIYMKHFPGVKYFVWDYERSRYPISGTEVRNNYLKHWDYILGSARRFFCRRVLITGTESCGKSTLTKYLAKIYHTSWSEEYGRYYSRDYLGGNEDLFTVQDFGKIAWIQRQQDEEAMKTANRVVLFDSDAVTTQYYCDMYMGCPNPEVERFVDPQRYDLILMMGPEVDWVDDGLRFKAGQAERERLHRRMLYMYIDRGFKDRIIEIHSPHYEERLDRAIECIDNLLADRHYMSRY